ncbi:CvpA family protein [Rossellomorea marisflavi]|uniref:CvpA family protein n=1 Tax=Rossellomorea marisflavi TaxID=189381 RepID=A0A5D4S063_9BACI|nr:CvpA family protein [Rossellomorea marisflavi]TYS57033.1 CvpA family protein [Rossellomorea marisflavi]
MLDIILLVLLLFGFLIGLKRGFILQVIHIFGFIASFIVAYLYYDQFAPKLTLWIPYPNLDDQMALKMIFQAGNMEDAYYRVIAFTIIFIAVRIILQIIGSMLDFVAHLPILKQVNKLGGGVLGFAETYLILLILLFIGALLPMDSVQSAIQGSFLGQGMVKNTPIFSDMIQSWWMGKSA